MIIPSRIDVFVHFDKFVIEYVEIKGGMTAEDENEVMGAVDDLGKTLADPLAGKE